MTGNILLISGSQELETCIFIFYMIVVLFLLKYINLFK